MSADPTPIRRRRRSKPVEAAPIVADVTSEEDEAQELEAPALETLVTPAEPPAQLSFLERAKARLGFAADEDVKPKAAPARSKLTKQQQDLVDTFAPMAADLGVDLGQFAWRKIGGNDAYAMLAPSEEVSAKIYTPLVRIAVRHLKFAGKVTPDSADLTASLLAVAGYTWASVRMFSEMKKQEKAYGFVGQEEEGSAPASRNARTNAGGNQNANGAHPAAARNGAHPAPVQAVPERGGDSVVAAALAGRNLTPSERFQFERLAVLQQRDIEARRRRSGVN